MLPPRSKTTLNDGIQIFGGTIVLFFVVDDKVFVAADSRVHTAADAPLRNDGCKIISLSNDTIFFYTGGIARVEKHGETLYSANQAAKDAHNKLAHTPKSRARLVELANHWINETRPVADWVLENNSPESIADRLQMGGFAGQDENGIPRLILATMDIKVFNNGSPSKSEFNVLEWPKNPNEKIGFGGSPSLAGAGEFVTATTVRGKEASTLFHQSYNKSPEDRQFHACIAAMESALKWAPDDYSIGGAIDAVLLEAQKPLRWLRRKKSCRKEDLRLT